MEEKDLKQISEVIEQKLDQKFSEGFRREFPNAFKESFQEEFGQIWSKNLAPALDDIHDKLGELEAKVNNLPTKSYMDDKLADLGGGVIFKLRKEDEKVNGIISILKKHEVAPRAELEDLDNLQIFPKVQI